MLYLPVYDNQLDQRYILHNVVFNLDGCWEWTKGTCSGGYGRFRYNGIIYRAHRYSYFCFNGSIPEGMLVRHLCHNRLCCNPPHLALGTEYDNWHDSANTHLTALRLLRKSYIINGIEYLGCVETAHNLGIHPGTLSKYTDPNTRIFNIEEYRKGCLLAKKIPRI